MRYKLSFINSIQNNIMQFFRFDPFFSGSKQFSEATLSQSVIHSHTIHDYTSGTVSLLRSSE